MINVEQVRQMALLKLAKTAFDAYKIAVGEKTCDGKSIPEFSDVTPNVQAGWQAAALAVVNAIATIQTHELVQPPTLGILVSDGIAIKERIGG